MRATRSSDDALFTVPHHSALDLCTGCIDLSFQELLADSTINMLPHATDPPHLPVPPTVASQASFIRHSLLPSTIVFVKRLPTDETTAW